MAHMVADLLSADAIRRRGLLDVNEVTRQRQMFERGQADYAYAIFTYLTLELWARAFMDGPAVAIDGPCAAVDTPAVDLQPV
jgi:hypothetical protein